MLTTYGPNAKRTRVAEGPFPNYPCGICFGTCCIASALCFFLLSLCLLQTLPVQSSPCLSTTLEFSLPALSCDVFSCDAGDVLRVSPVISLFATLVKEKTDKTG